MDKEKIKEQYESSELELEVLVKEKMTKIREQVKILEAEAERIGEETEKRLKDKKIKKASK
jgi:hypothetical protein